MALRGPLRLLLAAALGCAAGCREPPPAPAPAAAFAWPPISLQGIRALLPPPDGLPAAVRRFDADSPPVLVVRGPWPEGARVRLDDGPEALTTTVEVRGAVTLVRVDLPAARCRPERVVQLVVEANGAAEPWRSTLVLGDSPDTWPALAELRARVKPLPAPEAIAALNAALPTLKPAERLWLSVDLARRRASVSAAEGEAGWRAAADEARAQGVSTEVGRRLRAAAAQATRRRDFVETGRLLDAAEAAEGPNAAQDNPAAVVRLSTARAYREKALGNLRRATSLLESATTLAWESGLDADWAASSQALAALWQDQGRHADALGLMERVSAWYATHPKALDGGATLANNHGWILSRAMADGALPFDAARPRALYEAARREARERDDAVLENIAFASLGQLALDAGDAAAARALRDEWGARVAARPGFSQLEAGLLAANVDLLDARFPQALATFRQWEKAARAESEGLVSDTVLRALHGEARALAGMGRRREARAAYDTVLADLDRLARRTDLQQDRSPFLARSHRLFEEATALALADGDADAAFDRADAGQAPALQSLSRRGGAERRSPAEQMAYAERLGRWLSTRDALDAGRRALTLVNPAERDAERARLEGLRAQLAREFDALSEAPAARAAGTVSARARALRERLAPDEALLAFTRLADHEHAFLLRPGAPTRAFGPADALPALLATVCGAAAPACPALEGVNVVYVVPGDVAGARDLPEALSAAGSAATPAYVPFGGWLLDAGQTAAGAPLVVADPEGNLPHARLEGEDAVRHLTARSGPPPSALVGPAATHAAVLSGLRAGPNLFHYSGHGVLDAESPWDAHLRLTGGARLTVADVLLVGAPLGTVVLSGCETGGGMALSRREHVSLAEAFLLGGARTVLATRDRVDDAAARRILDRFHAEGGAGAPFETLQRLRSAGGLDAPALRVLQSFAIFGRAR